jgi:hypothetical protein
MNVDMLELRQISKVSEYSSDRQMEILHYFEKET